LDSAVIWTSCSWDFFSWSWIFLLLSSSSLLQPSYFLVASSIFD